MSLRQSPLVGRGDYLRGAFVRASAPDGAITSISPADLDDTIGEFPYARAHADAAVTAAREALPAWRRTSPSARAELLRAYARAVTARKDRLTTAIARAIGKPLWEARTEVDAVIAKVDITLTAGLDLVKPQVLPEIQAAIRYRPVGVCAVLGPFNFPAHLPNGHMVPALATGNTVVFKPSEKAPEVGEIMAECFAEAGLPAGVFNLVQGGAEVAQALVGNADVDAVMFTGSTAVGRAILAQSAQWPGRMLALELGGKNSALVLSDADLDYAAREIAFAAYVTAGQRCTATSRVLVQRPVAEALIERLAFAARETRVGAPDAPDVFLGPVITAGAAERALSAVRAAADHYDTLVAPRRPDLPVRGHYVSPALFRVKPGHAKGIAPALDCEEFFSPILTVEVVDSEDEAIERANATRYGLATCVYTASAARFDRIAPELEAGICNWNRGTVGSSSKLPFGGVKDSGNHRPAGLYSTFYCVDAVAELRIDAPKSGPLPPGLRLP